MLIAVLPLFASCAKNVEVQQEVELSESGRKVLLRRMEVFSPKLSEFSFKKRYARSELSIVNVDLPVWKHSLLPIYFGELRDNAGYVLVAVVPAALECGVKDQPAAYYVVFGAAKERWHEIPLPPYLEGRTANLALIVEDYPLENDPIFKKIDPTAKAGC